jgi:hypothetical protein
VPLKVYMAYPKSDHQSRPFHLQNLPPWNDRQTFTW